MLPKIRSRWLFLCAALAAGAAIGLAFALVRPSSSSSSADTPMRPDATWAAGAQLAPTFRLRDETGAPLTLASLRGRPVIITFVDPICHSLCPLEARVLSDAVQSLPAGERVPIISVSVNPAQDKRSNFALDARRWRLAPSWRWAVGSYRQLAAVWRAYHIAVQTQRREVAHTEGAYIIDAKGYQRALFLYPFQAEDVARVIKDL